MTAKAGTRNESLEKRIEAHYEALPPAERRLGDLLLQFPGDIANFSATELAEMAGTSKAAATRFFRRLGYTSFSEAREEIRDASRWGSPIYMAEEPPPTNHRGSIVAEQIWRDHDNLARTLEALDPAQISAIVDALASARQVVIIGFRNSQMLAFYLYRQLILLRAGVRLLPSIGQTIGEDLVDLGPEDLVVVTALRRRVAVVVKAMDMARNAGARCLLVTDPSAARTRSLATWTVTCEVRGVSVFDSYSAAMSVLNLLCTAMFRLGGKSSHARLRRIEQLHDDLDELDTTARYTRSQDG